MKRYFIIMGLLLSVGSAVAQNRQEVANFSQFKQYFNPALTGYEGSTIKNFYRDQWPGIDDSPRTLFLSGEFSLAGDATGKVQHAFGISLLSDRYGAMSDNRTSLSYSSGVKLSSQFQLKAGAAVSHTAIKVDPDKLVFNEDDDQAYNALLNDNNRVSKYGVNLGVSLTSSNFYAGYALNDLFSKDNSDNEYFKNLTDLEHNLQVGYRRSIDQFLGLVLNGIYRYDDRQKGTFETQLKGVYSNTFWIGAGYRNDLAYTFTTGLQLKHIRVGYSREVNSGRSSSAFRGGNELTLSYHYNWAAGKTLSIW